MLSSIIHADSRKLNRKGIVSPGGSGTRLYPLTQAVSKQLMPVCLTSRWSITHDRADASGIRDILIITTPEDSAQFRHLL
ncbi:MAG: sugar phosphate nucleotidyltransferase [Thiothrix sp.]